jgi:hypothetical protein
MELIKEKHTNENNALVVDDYPYGFRQRTKIRYWVESVKNKGDRFCSQTLNPKTNQWNKPKKSTYSALIVLVKSSNGHIKTRSLSGYSSDENLKQVEEFLKDYELNEIQKREINIIKAYRKAHEGVTYTCKPVKYINKYTGGIKNGRYGNIKTSFKW